MAYEQIVDAVLFESEVSKSVGVEVRKRTT